MKLYKIIQNIDILHSNNLDLYLNKDISGISNNSKDKNIEKNSIFIAYKGSGYDSHKDAIDLYKEGKISFIISEKVLEMSIPHIVVKNGSHALAIISRNFYSNPLKDMLSIAVTGTNGKTTSNFLIAEILKTAGKRPIIIGTTGIYFENNYIELINTSPNPKIFYKYVRYFLDKGADSVILELSSHALEQGRLYGEKFTIGIFTNLSHEHLDYHKDMESYYLAKKLLFTQYTKNSIINIDDEYGERLAKEIPNSKTFSIDNKNSDLYITSKKSSTQGSVFNAVYKGSEYVFTTNLIGLFNIYNCLGAILGSLSLGTDITHSQQGLERLKGAVGRVDKVYTSTDKGFNIYVDYAHTPDALDNVLKTLKSLPHNRLITVFGAGGDRDTSKRPTMASIAQSYSDIVIITSDNPRTESPLDILSDIKAGFTSDYSYIQEVDRDLAIGKAINLAEKNDIILIAGKGHENYQILGQNKIFFDDKLVSQKYLSALKVSDICRELPNIKHSIAKDSIVNGAEIDSRKIKLFNIFFGMKTENSDGNIHSNKAIENGASLVICDSLTAYNDISDNKILVENTLESLKQLGQYYLSIYKGKKVALTGSVGKTTTKSMLISALAHMNPYANTGNYNNYMGVPLSCCSLNLDSNVAIFELGTNNKGEIAKLSNYIKPDIALLISVGSSHIGNFGSIDNIAKEKISIADSLDEKGIFIVSDTLKKYMDSYSKKYLMYGDDSQSFIQYKNHRSFDNKQIFDVVINNNDDKQQANFSFTCTVPSFHLHNARNAVAALSVAYLLDVDSLQASINSLQSFYSDNQQRGDIIEHHRFTIIDDTYNSSFESIESGIKSLNNIEVSTSEYKTAILGELKEIGSYESTVYKDIVSLCGKYTDMFFILCGKNYIDTGNSKAGNIQLYETKEEMLASIKKSLKNGYVYVKASRSESFEDVIKVIGEI